MAIPLLNALGLLPEGVHDCEANEVLGTFCASPARLAVWHGFEGFLAWVATQPGPVSIFMDGSFVTDKASPGDIDVAIDITGCSVAGQNEWLIAFHREHASIKRQFRTDFYPLIKGAGSDFTAFFQYVRVDEALARGAPQGTRKGILRLVQ
ncbi:MAG: hypothetical protein V4472_09375 [Pseudomonadota bacterium]